MDFLPNSIKTKDWEIPCPHEPANYVGGYFMEWTSHDGKKKILIQLCKKCKLVYWEEPPNVK